LFAQVLDTEFHPDSILLSPTKVYIHKQVQMKLPATALDRCCFKYIIIITIEET